MTGWHVHNIYSSSEEMFALPGQILAGNPKVDTQFKHKLHFAMALSEHVNEDGCKTKHHGNDIKVYSYKQRTRVLHFTMCAIFILLT